MTWLLIWQNNIMEPRKDRRLFPYLKEAWIALVVSTLITWLLRDTDGFLLSIFYIITGLLFIGLTYWVPQIWFVSKAPDGIRRGKKETLIDKIYDFLSGFYWLVYLVIFVSVFTLTL